MNKYLRIGILVVIAAAVVYLVPRKANSPSRPGPEVTDFESCVNAGNPILETYPAQCRTPDGRTFTEEVEEEPAEVVVETPVMGAVVGSPLEIKGRAKGNWYFEAQIPVTLKDQDGKVLAKKAFWAEGDWMTTDFVGFSGSLEFEKPQTDFGLLLIEKDNPSGLPQFDAAYAIPVRFR